MEYQIKINPQSGPAMIRKNGASDRRAVQKSELFRGASDTFSVSPAEKRLFRLNRFISDDDLLRLCAGSSVGMIGMVGTFLSL